MVSLADISISRGYESDCGSDEDLSYRAMESVFTAPEIGRDERRMQVRAYNHWLAAVQDGELPAIEELRPEELADLGPSGVLVDLTLGLERPAIIFLGEKLAAECGDEREIFGLGDVPERSLLSRLTEHCLDVVATRSPVGFEAEFSNKQGQPILYRSMLLPYSSDGSTVDFVFGVISWKDGDLIGEAPVPVTVPEPLQPAAEAVQTEPPEPAPSLASLLASARALAANAKQFEDRSHRALYAAIGRLRDCARAAQGDPAALAVLLDAAGLPWQERAPLVGLARLAFGPEWTRSRLSEIALVLGLAGRRGLTGSELQELLRSAPGGLKGLLGEERRLRRGQAQVPPHSALRPTLARRLRSLPEAVLSPIGEFSLLVARRNPDGSITLLGDPGELRLLETAASRLVAA